MGKEANDERKAVVAFGIMKFNSYNQEVKRNQILF